ncbi:cysteine hydrolase family protein [Dictyobacter arantiisoli]|uniref:Nicotinamidase n=1 Tax=Dictyobacter arantiisoli TaxID=2014874 RepID=A0A5A5TAV0_9CHLR|nr:isochorismatase family cysteine hydrolase [Dictyobacter arantiisoli]GCF08552.1 nicotinamidase [Dictyobacter arantiisoli]
MTTSSLPEHFLAQSHLFLEHMVAWEQNLSSLTWQELQLEAQAGQCAIFSVDMLNGFCHAGGLASPRIKGIIPAVVDVLQGAYAIGVRDFILAQDSHTPESVEFAQFPPHCQAGTSEAETIPELVQLPFADLYRVIAKNSLNAFHGTSLGTWLEQRHNLRTAVIVGNCTDLCVYQMAMHLKLYANAHNWPLRVIIPANAVQTYDIPVTVAQESGLLAHDGDFLHLTFLHHMAINGIEVVRAIQ